MIRKLAAVEKKSISFTGMRAMGAAALTMAAAAAALLMPGKVRAATDTWAGGANDGLWSSAANWSPATTPVGGDTLSFGSVTGASTVLTDDITATFASMVFNGASDGAGASAAYTFGAGGFVTSLNVSGTITDRSSNGNAVTFNLPVSAGAFAFGGSGNSMAVFNNGGTFTGALTSTTNGGTADVLTVGAGSTVTFGGASTIGVGAGTTNSNTSFTVTGGASSTLTLNNSLSIGSSNNTGSGTSNNETVNLTGIGNFNLATTGGSLNVGTGNQTNATLLLSNGNNTINVGTINVGNFANGTGIYTDLMQLGAGNNTVQAANITIGRGVSGAVNFLGAAGQVTIQGVNGGSATANVTVGVSEANSTTQSLTSSLLLAGHAATLNLGTFIIAQDDDTNFNGPTNNATVTFDTGTLTANTLQMSRVTNSHGKTNAILTIGGGNVTVNTAFDIIDNTTNNGNAQVSVLNLNGGNVTLNTSIDEIISGTNASSAANSTISFSGGTLNMTGHSIGLSGNSAAGFRANVDHVTMPASGHTFTLMNLGTTSAVTGGTTVADGINGAGLTMNGAGTLILEGTNTYGQTTVSSGVLQVGSGSNTGTPGTGTVTANGGTLRFNRNDTFTVNNTIAGGANGTVEQAGSGTLILNGANTYAGKTLVSGGTLAFTSSNTIASSSTITVNAAGTLDGSAISGGFSVGSGQTLINNGTVNGTVAVGNGAAFTGAGGTYKNDVNVSGTGVYNIRVNAGTADNVNVLGTANFAGDSNLNITQTVAPTNSTYVVMTAGLISGLTGTDGQATHWKQIGRTIYDIDTAQLTNNVLQLDVSGGPANIIWNNTGGSPADGVTWDVQTNQNWQNNGSADVFFTNDNVTFNDNNNGNYNVTVAAGGVAPLTMTVSNNNQAYTFSGGAVGGNATLTMNGSNTVVMTNTNTYSGGTIISSGTIDVGNGVTTGSLGTGTINNSGTLVLDRSDTTTFSTAIAGTGAVQIKAPGTLTLSGANTFSGPITIVSGVLKAGSTGALGATAGGTLTINSGTSLDLNNFLVNTGRQIVVSGAGPDGNGAIVNNSATNQTTSGNYIAKVSLAANTTIGGVARWDFRGNTPVIDLNGNTLTKKGTNQVSVVAGTIRSTGGAGLIDVTQGVLSLETSTNVDSAVSTGSIVYEAGTLAAFFENTGNINWPMTMMGGNLIGNGGTISASIASPVTLDGNVTFEPIATGAGSATANNPLVWTGAITESGGSRNVTKLGINTTTLTSANSNWTGVTEIDAGILAAGTLADGGQVSSIGASSASASSILLGMANATVFGELSYAGSTPTSTNRKFTITSTEGGIDASGSVATATLTMSDTGPLTFSTSGAHTFVLSGTNTGGNTYAGIIQDNGGATVLQKSGTGTWVLTGANTYTGGTNIQQGTLALGSAAALPANSVVAIGNATGNTTGTLDLDGNSETVANLATVGTGTTSSVTNGGTADATLTFAGVTSVFNGALKDGATNKLALVVSSGSLTISQDGTYSGGTTINNGGTLLVTRVTASHTPMGIGSLTVNTGGTLVGNNADAFGYAAGFAPQVISINGGTVTDAAGAYRITLRDVHFTNGGLLTNNVGNGGDANGQYSLLAGTIESDASSTTAVVNAAKIALQNGVTTFTAAAGSVTGGSTPGVDLSVASVLANYNTTIGSVVKNGAGVMQLAAVNTYTGDTTVNGGELDVTSTGAIASGNITVSAGTFTVQSGGSINSTPNVTNNGTVNFNNATRTIGTLNGTSAGASVALNTTNLTVSAGGSYAGTIADNSTGGALTVSAALSVGAFNVGTVNANANLQIHGTSKTSALNLIGGIGAWSTGLDLTTSKFVFESTISNKSTDLGQIEDQVNFGKTNTAGIFTSSTLASNMGIAVLDNAILNKTTFGGMNVDSNSILVGAELFGDANADGSVDLTDLSTVLNNFGSTTSAWTSGNFDGAATIDLTDLSDVLNNFGATNASASAGDSVFSSAGAAVATPEPASLAVIGLGVVGLLARRRKA